MGCASSAPAAATSAPKVSSFHEQLTAAVKARCRKAAPKPVPEYPGSARPRNSEIPAQKLEAAEAAGAPKSLDMVLMKLPKARAALRSSFLNRFLTPPPGGLHLHRVPPFVCRC